MTLSSRYTPVAPYRQMLGDLRGKHPHGELARRLGVSPRTLHRAINAGAVNITLKLADTIRFEAGEHETAEQDVEPVTRAAVAEYATTPEGEAFIARCRLPRKYRQEVAA